jgi:hypothetical protein
MKIIEVPPAFQPNYVSTYPPYSSGKNTEENCYDVLKGMAEDIDTDYVYIPIFWTSIYTERTHHGNFDDLYNWIENLDDSQKYFTVVQNDCGIFVRNFDKKITVFSAGGGGLNIKNGDIMKELEYNGVKRFVFTGNKGDYDLPLMCLPYLESKDPLNRDIVCSFAGRYDTHWCRFRILERLIKFPEFKFFESTPNIKSYEEILRRSVFTLAPRGFGYTSFRMFEAIHMGSIPIYVWEHQCVLPFNDVIDWSTFSIVINIEDIDQLPEILRTADIVKMQQNLEKVRPYFTYEYVGQYIKGNIADK